MPVREPGPRAIEVLDAGALTTVQDRGRPGWAHLGVPRAGALDRPALDLANRLVGNEETAAALETTLTGLRFRLGGSGSFAVTGAHCEVRVDDRPVGWGLAHPAPAGAEIRVGPALDGVRSYVALGGGIDVPAVLGSRSTDLLSGLGPQPLRTGQRLPLGAARRARHPAEAVPRSMGDVLRVRLGPRADWFTGAAVAALDGATYVVTPESNRIGLRLSGPVLSRARDEELPTEGMVLGAVQVPPSGQPIVFLNDHPTTGGYPVLAVVVADDLPVCAQARPGAGLTVRVVR